MSDKPFIDEVLLNGYVESLGKDIVNQMFDLYKEQSVIYIDEIAASLPDGSQQDWHERCHKFKGAASSVGLFSLNRCNACQCLGQNGCGNPDEGFKCHSWGKSQR